MFLEDSSQPYPDVAYEGNTMELPLHKRNLRVLWFGNFFIGVGISCFTPFVPLFIDTLGEFSKQELSFYSGIVVAAPFLMMALISPVWGRLADRKGRKLMLLRSSLGMSIFTIATSLVTNVWMLLIVRAVFGLFSGFISNSIALMAVQVPKEKSGKALGTLNTANVAGMLFGPIFGGTVVSFIGYRSLFLISGSVSFLVFLLTLILVKENFTPVAKGQTRSIKHVLSTVSKPHLILGMYLATLIVMTTEFAVNPIISLYVRDLLPTDWNLEFWSGVSAAAPGLTTIICSRRLGTLGDRVGTHKILIFGLIIQLSVYLPLAFVNAIWQLIVLRLFIGVANAALLPSVQAILSRNAPIESTSCVFAYNQSAQSIGMVIGPLVGSSINGFFSFRYVFFATMAFSSINLINVLINTRKQKDTDNE